MEEYDRNASSRSETSDVWIAVPCSSVRPVNAPPPLSAHQRRDSAGADTTPATTSSPTISPISVAQTGTPRT